MVCKLIKLMGPPGWPDSFQHTVTLSIRIHHYSISIRISPLGFLFILKVRILKEKIECILNEGNLITNINL